MQGHVHAQKIPEKEESPSHSSLVDSETLRKEEVKKKKSKIRKVKWAIIPTAGRITAKEVHLHDRKK